MYLPKLFEESDPEAMHEFMRQHPLATLVTRNPEGLCADHVPMLIAPTGTGQTILQCHVARANPVWRDLGEGKDVLAIFQDAGVYITPSWYPSKAATGMVVPTWNYIAVHASGRARAVEDPDWLRAFLTRLTDTHEAGRERPWRLTDAPEGYIAAQLRLIVGIEITVAQMSGKWKVSQNKSAADAGGVVRGLRGCPHPAAQEMALQVQSRKGAE